MSSPSGTQPEPNGAPAPDRIGRVFVALVVATLVAQLVALQGRESIFGGGGWLTHTKYIAWSERLGLFSVLALFTVAAVGGWLLLWTRSLAFARVRPQRALAWGAFSWVLLNVLDLSARYKLGAVLGDAFGLAVFSDGVGGLKTMAHNMWRWYWREILWSLGGLVGFVALGLVAMRYGERLRGSWGIVDRVSRRAVRVCTAVSLVGVVVFLTAFAHTWPETRALVVDETLVGMPFGVAVVWATDFDRDGYSQFDNPPDTAPHDEARHPYAIDRPGDGIDQDLLFGDLDPSVLPEGRRRAIERVSTVDTFAPTRRRNVVLVVLESTRFDALTAQVDGRKVMPRMQVEIAAGALAPTRAYATRGFTNTSLGNLFWGTYFDPGSSLLDDLRPHGWEIAAFSGYDLAEEGVELSAGLRPEEVRFDPRSDTEMADGRDTSPGRRVAAAFEAWLQERDERQPFLVYMHLQDPHFPYDQDNPSLFVDDPLPPGDIVPERADDVYRSYMEQVHYVDAAAGRILDALRARPATEDAIVFFMGDHGEALFDDGLHIGHGVLINELMTHSAWVVVNSPIDVPDVTSHLDVRPLVRRMLTEAPIAVPRVVEVPEAAVLHYIGNANSPSAIGELTAERGRLIYDFEAHRITDEKTGESGRLEAGEVSDALLERGRVLVDGWAYLRVLNQERGGWRVP